MSKIKILVVLGLFVTIGAGVYINLKEKASIDASRLPDKVSQDRAFLRWVTNVKNKEIPLEAKEFTLLEEQEAYNTRNIRVYSIDEDGMKEYLEETLLSHKVLDRVFFSPSERLFLDLRPIQKEIANSTQVRFFGQRESKIIDAKIAECYSDTNCFFDRAYFLTNDFFVIHEISLADKKDPCAMGEICNYIFRVHLVDLINNKTRIYVSNEYEIDLTKELIKVSNTSQE